MDRKRLRLNLQAHDMINEPEPQPSYVKGMTQKTLRRELDDLTKHGRHITQVCMRVGCETLGGQVQYRARCCDE